MTYDDMNLCASWYPVFIVVDDGFFSHPSSLTLTFVVFGTSAVAVAGDPRGGGVSGALAGCADKEPELEEALFFLFFLGRFFNFSLGVVTARKTNNAIISFFFLLFATLGGEEPHLPRSRTPSVSGPSPGRPDEKKNLKR